MNQLVPRDDNFLSNATNQGEILLTREEFQQLALVPPEAEWFANIQNKNTRRAYEYDVKEFFKFVGIEQPMQIRHVFRAHVIAWRKTLKARDLSPATIRRKIAALSSLFNYLCDCNTVTHNPVNGVKRPNEGANKGKTPALGESQARELLSAPDKDTLKGKRDRALISLFLYHGLRREEVARLKIKDIHTRQGVVHLAIHGKGDKERYIPFHPEVAELVDVYLEEAGHKEDLEGFLFRSLGNRWNGKSLTPSGIYKIVAKYADQTGLKEELRKLSPHTFRSTAATNALEHNADLAKVQEWLGHANIATTRIYDYRDSKPKDSPTFKVSY